MAQLQSAPDLEWWMSASKDEISTLVRAEHLAVKLALDGSTRYTLLKNPDPEGTVRDLAVSGHVAITATLRIIDLLFSLGIETAMVLCVWPPDIERRDGHLQTALQGGKMMALGREGLELYRRWNVRSRLYGNYDIAPGLAPISSELRALQAQFVELMPDGERLMLWGYAAGTPNEELIARSILLFQELGRIPTEDELRRACFPFGPDKLDIYLTAGWLRAGVASLPPILNKGTDIYCVSHLIFELNEYELRRILYDSLFLRRVSSLTDKLVYPPTMLASLAEYYDEHRNCMVGLGHVVAEKFWYPDHEHVTLAYGPNTKDESRVWSR